MGHLPSGSAFSFLLGYLGEWVAESPRERDGKLPLHYMGVFQGRHLATCSGSLQPHGIKYQLVTIKSGDLASVARKSQQFGTWQAESHLENPGARASAASSGAMQRDRWREFVLWTLSLP